MNIENIVKEINNASEIFYKDNGKPPTTILLGCKAKKLFLEWMESECLFYKKTKDEDLILFSGKKVLTDSSGDEYFVKVY